MATSRISGRMGLGLGLRMGSRLGSELGLGPGRKVGLEIGQWGRATTMMTPLVRCRLSFCARAGHGPSMVLSLPWSSQLAFSQLSSQRNVRSFSTTPEPQPDSNKTAQVVPKTYTTLFGWQTTHQILSIPNLITLSRIGASPFLAYALMNDMNSLALSIFAYQAFSDFADGYVARKYQMQTTLGAFLDPMADKVIIGAVSIGLGLKGLIPLPLVGLIVGRDVFLLAAVFIIRGLEKAKDAPFFDTTETATFHVTPTMTSKVNTVLQMGLLLSTIANMGFSLPPQEVLEGLWYATGATTSISWLQYIMGRGIKRVPPK